MTDTQLVVAAAVGVWLYGWVLWYLVITRGPR